MKDKLKEAALFLDKVFQGLREKSISVEAYELDHLCYRTSTEDEYRKAKQDMADLGKLLTEALINGRPIASFLLHEPITYGPRRISVIEIPAPKPGYAYKSGWEHVEFVITESFDEFLHKNSKQVFDRSGLSKAHNPELILGFSDFVVKFHKESLYNIIQREVGETC